MDEPNPAYADTLELAKKELASKKCDLHKLQAEVERLQRTVWALRSLIQHPRSIDPTQGITEGVKTALRMVAPAGMYPTTVRIKLEEAGFSFDGQKNPMA